MRTPAYVEVRPDTREITRLFIPLVSRVAKIDRLHLLRDKAEMIAAPAANITNARTFESHVMVIRS